MKARPEQAPTAPTTPTHDGWMSYGGHRAHCRRMEDWDDEMRHWHHDAKKRGLPCYADCPTCEDETPTK
ncbi:hypothetical protein N9917_00135 [Deltaproteobacteria bacterium]|nr:hypothetical protein [Deltaproteobacteria bacterium]